MMELKDQVISLEYAKRLKELGVKQDSFFYWTKRLNEPYMISSFEWKDHLALLLNSPAQDGMYSAFSVAELGEMLPESLWGQHSHGGGTQVILFSEDGDFTGIDFFDEHEANARAKMLIHLIENKLWEPS